MLATCFLDITTHVDKYILAIHTFTLGLNLGITNNQAAKKHKESCQIYMRIVEQSDSDSAS